MRKGAEEDERLQRLIEDLEIPMPNCFEQRLGAMYMVQIGYTFSQFDLY